MACDGFETADPSGKLMLLRSKECCWTFSVLLAAGKVPFAVEFDLSVFDGCFAIARVSA